MDAFYATVSSKGQITLPVEIRRILGITEGQKLAIRIKDGSLVIDAAFATPENSEASGNRMRKAPPRKEPWRIRPAFVVGAAIVDSVSRPTRLLAAQRSYPDELAGQWEFPGGKVEPGESAEQALHREIREELGCKLILGPRIHAPQIHAASAPPRTSRNTPTHSRGARAGSRSAQPTARTAARQDDAALQIATQHIAEGDWQIPVGYMRVWLAEIAPGSLAPSPHSSHRELRWVGRDTIPTLPWLAGDVQIIPELLQFFA